MVKSNPSPLSTGAAGTVLEHRIGAILLATVLTGDAFPGFGDGFAIDEVHAQASDKVVVDDFLVEGHSSTGSRRLVAIAARRAPNITKSDVDTRKLVGTLVEAYLAHRKQAKDGSFGMVLATASVKDGVRELQKLTRIALQAGSASEFRGRVLARAGHTSGKDRSRLEQFDALIALSLVGNGASLSAEEITWEVLRVLTVEEFRLEQEDRTDQTACVNSLRSAVPDSSLDTANALFHRLCSLMGDLAPSAAVITEAELRRRLPDFPLSFSPRHPIARRAIEFLQESARELVQDTLGSNGPHIPRPCALAALGDFFGAIDGAGVISGEPDVGKSALALAHVDAIHAADCAAIFLNLRDLPDNLGALLAMFGAGVEEVFAAYQWGSGALLVIDGAEAAVNGRERVLNGLVSAALKLEWKVALVSRSDSAGHAKKLLAAAIGDRSNGIAEHIVPGLDDDERSAVAECVPSLRRLEHEPRNAWLLGRIGLLDFLLRSDQLDALPDSRFHEHDVFHAIWQGLVIRHSVGGPARSGGARAAFLLELARRHLGMPTTQPDDFDEGVRLSLEADGLIRRRTGMRGQFEVPQFASDLVQDLAVAHYLLRDGWRTLADGTGPRSALRAARVAAAARLDTENSADEWLALRTELGRAADIHGVRWSEVPFEAALELQNSSLLGVSLLPHLVTNDGRELLILLQVATATHLGRPANEDVLAPIVEAFECDRQWRTYLAENSLRRVDGRLNPITLAWLAAAMLSTKEPIPLRKKLRNQLLAPEMDRESDFVLAALASLSTDLDEFAAQAIRQVGQRNPAKLGPVVESAWSSLALARSHPHLLVEWSEAYYLLPDPSISSHRYHYQEGAIRRHDRAYKTQGGAWPSALNGPFLALMRSSPLSGVRFINRMLNWEVKHRSARRPGQVLSSQVVNLPIVGDREIFGDGRDWLCSLGQGFAPDACSSALLAVDLYVNDLLAVHAATAHEVLELLLDGCESMAMLGLIVSILTRMLPESFDAIEPLLGYDFVWAGEMARATGERIAGRDPNDTAALAPLVQYLIAYALGMDDGPMLARFASLAHILRQREPNPRQDPVHSSRVQGWASLLNPDNYSLIGGPPGSREVGYTPPATVRARGEAELAEARMGLDDTQLSLRYIYETGSSSIMESLVRDIQTARSLDERDPGGRSHDIVVGVAAAGVVAFTEQIVTLDDEALTWCVDQVIKTASEATLSEDFVKVHTDSEGQAAARTLPLIMRNPSRYGVRDGRILRRAINLLSRRETADTIDVFADGLAPFWDTPCSFIDSICIHKHTWDALASNLAKADTGDDLTEPHGPPLDEPYVAALEILPAHRVDGEVLVAPMIISWDASRSRSCISASASPLFPVVREVWYRHLEWRSERRGYSDSGSMYLLATRMVGAAASGDLTAMTDELHWAAGNPVLLESSVEALAQALTYRAYHGGLILPVWTSMATTVLDDIEAGHVLNPGDTWTPYILGALLPRPHYPSGTADTDDVRDLTRSSWPHPSELSDLFERWLPHAVGIPKAVHSLLLVTQRADIDWQRDVGLFWLERAIGGRYDAIANKTDAHLWLQNLRPHLSQYSPTLPTWLRMVDALAFHGDLRAIALQRREE
jgi:hypothetical protein